MSWAILIIAGLFEAGWAIGLKYTEGFTKLIPSIFTSIAIVASMYFLSKSTQVLPIGTAYPVWVGIGAAATVFYEIAFLNIPSSPSRIFFLILLIISIIGLKLTSTN